MSHKQPIVSPVCPSWGRAWSALVFLLLGWLAAGPGALAAGPPPRSKPVPVARYTGSADFPSVLLRKGATGWKRVPKGQVVWSAEPLVTLPGFVSEVRSDKGGLLTMRGHVREFSRHPLM